MAVTGRKDRIFIAWPSRPLDRRPARRDKAGHENGTLHSPEHYSLAHALARPFSSLKIPG